VHLDRGSDYQAVRDDLAARGLHARIAERGKPAPIQAGHRWVIERTHAWMNNYGKLIRCTERHKPVVEFYLALAAPSSPSVVSSVRPGAATGGRPDLGAALNPPTGAGPELRFYVDGLMLLDAGAGRTGALMAGWRGADHEGSPWAAR
jgi:hypothetical protein